MSLAELEGVSYGPHIYRTAPEKVAEYVAATHDDPERWDGFAPPSLAGALLFVVTPELLADPRAAGDLSVIHGDQTFTWHRSIPLDTDLSVTGTVSRVRERGGIHFVGFDLSVRDLEGAVVEGASSFLMSAGAPAGGAEEQPEPAPADRGPNDPAVAGEASPLRRSASRADLVRYAGASRDFNPIHWDHDAAVAAGLSGVVVHGLLQSAWICQAAARRRPGVFPLASAKFRFRAPMRPGVAARVEGEVSDTGEASLSLTDGETVFVASTLLLAGG